MQDAELLAENGETIEIKILDEASAPIMLMPGSEAAELRLTVKPDGKRDTPPLTVTSAVEQNAAGVITMTLLAFTESFVDLAKIVNANGEDDVTEVAVELDLVYLPTGGTPRRSLPAKATMMCPVGLPDDLTPTSIPTRYFDLSEDGNYIEHFINGVKVSSAPRFAQ